MEQELTASRKTYPIGRTDTKYFHLKMSFGSKSPGWNLLTILKDMSGTPLKKHTSGNHSPTGKGLFLKELD